MVTYDDIVTGFRDLGLRDKDVVLVHSSFKSFGGVEGGPQTVIKALLDIIGKDGTLVMPTFTFSFCEQFNNTGLGYFDVDNTPSEMGIMTEIVRKMENSKRSVDPIYSVTVHGKLVNELSAVNDKHVFGRNSIFGKLHYLNGKLMLIGLDYNHSWTFIHYIENTVGVDYRINKDFSGVIVKDGKKYKDTYTMLVRDLDKGVVTDVNAMGMVLEEKGIIKSRMIGNSTVRLMEAKATFDAVAVEMKRDPRLLYRIQEKKESNLADD